MFETLLSGFVALGLLLSPSQGQIKEGYCCDVVNSKCCVAPGKSCSELPDGCCIDEGNGVTNYCSPAEECPDTWITASSTKESSSSCPANIISDCPFYQFKCQSDSGQYTCCGYESCCCAIPSSNAYCCYSGQSCWGDCCQK